MKVKASRANLDPPPLSLLFVFLFVWHFVCVCLFVGLFVCLANVFFVQGLSRPCLLLLNIHKLCLFVYVFVFLFGFLSVWPFLSVCLFVFLANVYVCTGAVMAVLAAGAEYSQVQLRAFFSVPMFCPPESLTQERCLKFDNSLSYQ